MKARRPICLIALAAIPWTLASCGSDDVPPAASSGPGIVELTPSTSANPVSPGAMPPKAGTGVSTTAVADVPPLPTVEELNNRFTRAFARQLTAEEKVSWFEYGGQDPMLIDNLVDAAKANHVTVAITDVHLTGASRAVATAKVTTPAGTTDQAIELVPDGGQWKVSSAFTCSIVATAGLRSPACPKLE